MARFRSIDGLRLMTMPRVVGRYLKGTILDTVHYKGHSTNDAYPEKKLGWVVESSCQGSINSYKYSRRYFAFEIIARGTP